MLNKFLFSKIWALYYEGCFLVQEMDIEYRKLSLLKPWDYLISQREPERAYTGIHTH